MAEVKILIVEDDTLIAEEIANTLKEAGYLITAITESCDQTLEAVKNDIPDLIFMDILLNGREDGIETARKLKKLGSLPIIFLTNLHDRPTLERAQSVNPANYLAKPFTNQQLLVSIERALLNFSENKPASIHPVSSPVNDIIPMPNLLLIKDKNGSLKKYEIDDILYLAADRAYCTIHTREEELLQTINMSHIKERINHPHMIQVSRSHVVNITKIDRIKGNMLVINGAEIKMGSHFKDDFLKHFNMVR